MENRGRRRFTYRVRVATEQIAHLRRHMAALQLLAIAGYYASLRLALNADKPTEPDNINWTEH